MLKNSDRAARRRPRPARAAIAAGLAAALGIAAAGCTAAPAAPAAPNPGASTPGAATPQGGMDDMPGMGEVTGAPTTAALAAAAPRGTGLSATLHGYTLIPAAKTVPANAPSDYAFRIDGPDGKPVTRYQPYESAFVICYVIRTDLTGFQLLQPAMRENGTWTVRLPALPAGSYRAFATFAAPDASQGTPLLYQLSSPFTVSGQPAAPPAPVPAPAATATVDGYTVTLSGDPRSGTSGPLEIVVSKGVSVVESFQRYLDAYVHLTAFHAGDLAFAQILSLGGVQASTGQLTAEALFPESGTWQVFAQFEVDGSVHTAALTLNVR